MLVARQRRTCKTRSKFCNTILVGCMAVIANHLPDLEAFDSWTIDDLFSGSLEGYLQSYS